MKLSLSIAGAGALALAACALPQRPLTDAHRAALADSVTQVATEMAASLANPATPATADRYMAYYAGREELVHAEYGMIYPSYDSLVKAVHAGLAPGSSIKLTFDQRRVSVLDRDVVVFTALANGAVKDPAGKETPFHEAWMAVFHRTSDGWKIVADHESTAPPAPPAPARKRS